MNTIQQLEDLKEWSQDSARYERRLNFRGGQLVQPGPGRQGYAGDEAALKKYLKNYKGKSFDRIATARKFGYKDKDVIYRVLKDTGKEKLLELPHREGAAKALNYLKQQPKNSSIQTHSLAKKLKVDDRTINRAMEQLPEKKFTRSKFKPSVLTSEEFIELYEKKQMSDKEFANYLNKQTKKTTSTGTKFNADTVFARRSDLGLKSQHPNPIIRGAPDLFIKNEAKRFNIDTKGVSKEELRRKVLSRRGDEQKALKTATDPEYLERQRMFRKRALANIKADPERLAAYKKYKSEYASKRTWGLVPVDKTSKGYLWRDLIDNSLRFQNKQLPNSHIQFLNAKEKRPTSIPATQDVKLIDVNILDKKGKPKILTYDTILKHIDDNSKRYGMSSKDILKEYEKKLFIQQDPELRDQLNKKVYSRYDPTKASSRAVLSPFHVHHTAGRGKNAFNVQLGVGTENMAENALRKKFNTDFKVAQTLTDKKNAMKKYINQVSDNLEVRFKNVPYGTRESFPDMLKRVGGKGFKMNNKQQMNFFKKMGYRCRRAGGGGETVACYMDDVKKTRDDLKSPNVEVRAKALTKQRKALQLASKIPQIGKILKTGVQMGTAAITAPLKWLGLTSGIGYAIEGIVEGGFYDNARRKGYSHEQAFAETFSPRLIKEGAEGKSTKDVPWYGGAEKLREQELIGDPKQNPKVAQYVDALAEQDRIYDLIGKKEALKGEPTTTDETLFIPGDLDAASADVQDLARSGAYRRVDQTLKPEGMAAQAYNTAVESQLGKDLQRKKEYLEKYDPGALKREEEILSRPRQLEKRYRQMEEKYPTYTREQIEQVLKGWGTNTPWDAGFASGVKGYDEMGEWLKNYDKSAYFAENFRTEKAGGGIAGIRRPWAIPPESGPMPQGGGLSSQFNRVRKLTG